MHSCVISGVSVCLASRPSLVRHLNSSLVLNGSCTVGSSVDLKWDPHLLDTCSGNKNLEYPTETVARETTDKGDYSRCCIESL